MRKKKSYNVPFIYIYVYINANFGPVWTAQFKAVSSSKRSAPLIYSIHSVLGVKLNHYILYFS